MAVPPLLDALRDSLAEEEGRGRHERWGRAAPDARGVLGERAWPCCGSTRATRRSRARQRAASRSLTSNHPCPSLTRFGRACVDALAVHRPWRGAGGELPQVDGRCEGRGGAGAARYHRSTCWVLLLWPRRGLLLQGAAPCGAQGQGPRRGSRAVKRSFRLSQFLVCDLDISLTSRRDVSARLDRRGSSCWAPATTTSLGGAA